MIASLNGVTDHGWVEYARNIEAAGAKAIELNIYYIPSDLSVDGAEVEARYIDVAARREGGGRYSGLGQDRPLFQLARAHGDAAWQRPGPTGWCCSTASTSPISILPG